jgi:hypothetical protein
VATRKQRKRSQKERRHEYETVWVDGEGNDLEEPPDDAPAPSPERRSNGGKSQQKSQQKGSSRPTRAPKAPSWSRATKRALLLGAAVFAFVALTGHGKNGSHAYLSALYPALLFAALFIPYIYGIERFTYRRWERKTAEQPKKR